MKIKGKIVACSIALSLILASCTNDLDKIKKITYDSNAPDEVAINMSIYFADSGYAKLNVFAVHSETYSKPHLTKLKDSLQVDFYSEEGEITSTLTAKYGEINHETGQMFVKDSVMLINHADQRIMRTTILYWNQNDSTIYTNENVQLDSPKGRAYGTSLKAKQDFTTYKITDPRGQHEFD